MEPAASSSRVLAFTAGNRRFGIAANLVREVGRLPRLTPVPHAPPSLLGLGNLRGEALPVVSAARLLGLDRRTLYRKLERFERAAEGGEYEDTR